MLFIELTLLKLIDYKSLRYFFKIQHNVLKIIQSQKF